MYITSENKTFNMTNEVFTPFIKGNQNLQINPDSFEKTGNNAKPQKDKKAQIKKASEVTGLALLGLGLVLAVVTRTGSGKFAKWLEEVMGKIDNNVIKLQATAQQNSFVDNLKLYANKYIGKPFNSMFTFLCNLDQLKNGVTTRIFNNIEPLKFIKDKIDNFLKRKAASTSIKKFRQFKNTTAELDKKLEEIIEKIKTSEVNETQKTELIDSLTSQRTENNRGIINLEEKYKNLGIEETALSGKKAAEVDFIKKAEEDFNDRLSGFINTLFSHTPINKMDTVRKLKNSIISREPEDFRKGFESHTIQAKESISKSIEDKRKECRELINQAKYDIKVSLINNGTENKFNDLEIQVINYGKKGNTREETDSLRKEAQSEFEKIANELITQLKKSGENSNENQAKLVAEAIKNIEKTKLIMGKDPGTLQKTEMLLNQNEKIIKEAAGKEFEEAKELITKSSSKMDSLNDSVENYLYRLLDLELGNGIYELKDPTIPLAFLAYEINNSDSKEEQTSKAIRYGFPVAGGLGAWYYAAFVKCLNGPQIILFSILTGLAFDFAGKHVDKDIYQKRIEQK